MAVASAAVWIGSARSLFLAVAVASLWILLPDHYSFSGGRLDLLLRDHYFSLVFVTKLRRNARVAVVRVRPLT